MGTNKPKDQKDQTLKAEKLNEKKKKVDFSRPITRASITLYKVDNYEISLVTSIKMAFQ